MMSSPWRGGDGTSKDDTLMTDDWVGGAGVLPRRYWRENNFVWREGSSIRKGYSYKWRSVPDVRDPKLLSSFLDLIFSSTFSRYLVHKLRHQGVEVEGEGGGYQPMTWWQGGRGAWNGQKRMTSFMYSPLTLPGRGSRFCGSEGGG